MLLQKLKEYGEREDVARESLPSLYNMRPIRYIIALSSEGRLLNRVPQDTSDPSERALRRGRQHPVPDVARAVGIRPLLLADKADYTLGYEAEGSRPDRVAAAHRAYLEQLDRCAQRTQEPDVIAVQRFLHDSPLEQLQLDDGFDPGALITFMIDQSRFPVELTSVQRFWLDENTDPDAPVMQCIVCGQERPVLDRLQGKVKGIPGGQVAGTSIISANAEAFESYGLEASLISPTCAPCGEQFTKAANELLGSQQNRLTVGNAAFIFWTRRDVGFDFFGYTDDPRPEQVRELLDSLRKGGGAPEVNNTAFYATSLSGSGGRAVVRDWIDTTVGEAKQHLERWFRLQRIVDPYGEEARPLGIYALAASTVRDARQDLAPPTPRALVRAALTGTPLPSDLLFQAVRRNKAEQTITRQRAALIKMVLLSQRENPKENELVQLDHNNKAPAYRCGRLLAVLEEAQKLALGNPNATIVDRFFGTASSAPASVFGRLLRGAQAHLGKLERDRTGAYVALQRRLEEILSGLDGFPRTLTLEEQGLFSLGYYHQRAFDRAQAREAAERRKDSKLAGVASPEAEADLNEGIAEVEEGQPEQS